MVSLDERSQIILESIIDEFVRGAEPVGSRTIAKKTRLNISSATIRNVMSDLEEMGFLYQPHTSAGRVPTSRGYRYYVDWLMETKPIRKEASECIDRRVGDLSADLIGMLQGTSRVLSDLIQHACIVVAPGPDFLVLKHINFVRLTSAKILVVLVGKSGLIQNRVFEYTQDISQDELDHISNYLNREVVVNRTIREIRKIIARELSKDRAKYSRLVSKALNFGEKTFGIGDLKVIIEGQSKIFEQPEFTEDIEKLKKVIRNFEEKATLLKLIDSTLSAGALQISIGAENSVDEFKDMSVISAGYRRSDSGVGTIGVIGPERMDYGRIIPFVEYAAHILSAIFEDK